MTNHDARPLSSSVPGLRSVYFFLPAAHRGGRVIGSDALRISLTSRQPSDGQERNQDNEDNPNIKCASQQPCQRSADVGSAILFCTRASPALPVGAYRRQRRAMLKCSNAPASSLPSMDTARWTCRVKAAAPASSKSRRQDISRGRAACVLRHCHL